MIGWGNYLEAERRAEARRLRLGGALTFIAAIAPLFAQTPRITNPPPPPAVQAQTGTGVIAGVLWSADQPPQPVRRAVVTLAGTGLPSPRSVLTNDTGEFTFTKLAVGTFTVSARKASYIAAAYGSQRPGRPGTSITLAAGQRMNVAMTMFKGAVIAGTLRDATGAAVMGVTVTATDARTVGTTNVTAQIESAVTDDRGNFRIYGLLPGDYLVSATPSATPGEMGARTASEMDTLLANLAQRPNTVAPASTPAPLPTPKPTGFAPIYYPGTPLASDATPVHVGPGEERLGASFELGHVRVATISGVVSGGVPNLAAVQLSMIVAGPRPAGLFGTMGITAMAPNAQGEFKYANVPPGQYRIVAKVRSGATESANLNISSGSSSGGGGTPAPTQPSGGTLGPNPEQLFAVADVTVRGEDIAGVGLTLQPGGTISGKLAFDTAAAPLPPDLSVIRVGLSIPGGSYQSTSGAMTIGNASSQVNPVAAAADGTFHLINIGPGPYLLNCQLPQDLLKVWKLRSAMVDGRDLLDGTIEGPNINLTGVTLTLSDKRTELSGTLQVAPGQSASDYYVVVFSSDRANWRAGSRRSLSAKPGTDSRYVLADLPAGDYYLAALTDLDPLDWQTAGSLEQIVPFAVRVQIAEGEKKVQNLKIGRP
ncbi:MAG TPA: carboxypeptidase-like regulatory domain-containing protein [Vicinamibacterales bacterium]|nr:carboxypeptidase-like regulatory domain-containing protein [Vicinamibacterales bacterium]